MSIISGQERSLKIPIRATTNPTIGGVNVAVSSLQYGRWLISKVDELNLTIHGFHAWCLIGVRFVRAMGVEEKVVNSMSRFDFSRTSHIRLVHSMSVFTSDSADNEKLSNLWAVAVLTPVQTGS